MKNQSSIWWLGIVTGIILVFIGWFLLTNTGLTTLRLIQVLGLYWLVAGTVDIVSSIFSSTVEHRGWKLAGGILGIIAGLVVLNSPVLSTIFTVGFLTYFIGFAFIFNGGVRIFLGRKDATNKFDWSWGSLLLGIIYVLVGLAVLGNAAFSAAVLLRTLGFLIIVGGIISIVGSFMFKGEAA
ncbi:MAG TPA: DUF308 domain-containing protein [Candidatus Saccharimonadales bacterium]|nr:DUF308 domain-containing protein [Candidatus Saccharimonadales bacterium]